MIDRRCPICRLSAVGSNPTYTPLDRGGGEAASLTEKKKPLLATADYHQWDRSLTPLERGGGEEQKKITINGCNRLSAEGSKPTCIHPTG